MSRQALVREETSRDTAKLQRAGALVPPLSGTSRLLVSPQARHQHHRNTSADINCSQQRRDTGGLVDMPNDMRLFVHMHT